MREETVKRLKAEIVGSIDVSKDVSDEEVYEIIDTAVCEAVKSEYEDIPGRILLRKKIFNSLRRLDVLQDLIEDESITEIMVNGSEKIFFERAGHLYLSERKFESPEKLEDIIQRIAAGVNRTVNEAHPIVDARLSDGSRVNVVLPPVSLDGAVVTIRKFARDIMSMDRLVELETITTEAADFLKSLVEGRYNIICSGGTGCGKSTMLNALSGFIDKSERVITIEDSAELIMDGLPNLVRLEARNANIEGKHEIDIRRLIKTALRMRPDRIIVGEVRGKEAIDMLQSLNTGHCGMSTGHANSPRDMLSRLETMVLLDENIPLAAIRSQIASAVDIIIGISRMKDGSRKVTEICEVCGMKDGEIVLKNIFEYHGRLVKVGTLSRGERVAGGGHSLRG